MPTPALRRTTRDAIVLVVNGVQIQGFAPGTFIKVSRNEPSFKGKAGAGGDYVRTRNRNRAASSCFTLLRSPSNDYLSGLISLDEGRSVARPRSARRS
jgi:hypothetical protein